MTCLHHQQVCTPLIRFHHLFQDCWQVRWSLALLLKGGGQRGHESTHRGFMVKSRSLLRQLLAASPFGLGILKSWMDLCQIPFQPWIPWIANPHPFPSYGTCFQPFLKWQVSGCYIYGMLSTEKPWRIPEMSRAYLQICFTIWYNMRSTNDFARSSQLQPCHTASNHPPKVKLDKNQGKTFESQDRKVIPL